MTKVSKLFLGKKRTIFVGYFDEPLLMAQGAATLCLSLGKPIDVHLLEEGRVISCTSVLIPANGKIKLDSKNQLIANINLDFLGRDFHTLLKKMTPTDEVYINLDDIDVFKKVISEFNDQPVGIEVVKKELESLFKFDASAEYLVDSRIEKAVDIIQHSIEENLSIDFLAKQVSLSVSGLTKLFKKQTGVPIRRYRQWHRIYKTATAIGKGQSLTDAALSAGFVDLPHCNHAFKMMLGMNPSFFLLRPAGIQIITEDDS